VSCQIDDKEIKVLKQNDSFGEDALIQGKHTLSAYAKIKTRCLALASNVLTQLLGENFNTAIYRNIFKKTLENLKILTDL